MTLVFDATPLIHLSKIKVLEELQVIKSKKLIPYSVFKEVVIEGKNIGKEDAFYIDNLINNNYFEVVKVENIHESLSNANLSKADKEVISYVDQKGGIAVMDEEAGRKIAELMNVKTIGSIGILFALLNHKKINKKELKEFVDIMIENGWFCSTKFYSMIIDKLER